MKSNLLVFLACALISLCVISCDTHTHSYSDDWSWDATYHWHAATCEHSDAVKDKAEHTIEKHEAKAATCTEKGWDAYVTCSVCGYYTYKEIEALGHDISNNQCTRCKNYFYSSVSDMNTNAKRDDILNKTVTVKVGTLKFENNADELTIGTSDLKGTSKDGEKATFIFKDGDITTNSTKYESIDNSGIKPIDMLIPEGSDVSFENVTFHGVVTFGGSFNSITFKNCEFTGTVLGYMEIVDVAFDGCTFNMYSNDTSAKASNPIWLRPASSGKYIHNFTFINNKVYGCLPVKLERVGVDQGTDKYTPVIKILDNYFDVSYKYGGTATTNLWTDNRNMGFMIRPDGSNNTDSQQNNDKNIYFTLYDDGNTKSEITTSVYVVDDDQTECFDSKGIKILDRDGNAKEIKALVFKSTDRWVTLKSIE